jgi:hypothetical protein
MAQHAAATGEPLLQQRFDAVTAELHVLRAAVARRDALLREQTEALREREARLRVLESARVPVPGAVARVKGLARRARGLVGRYVRTGLSHR